MRATELFLEWLMTPKGKDPDWVIEAGKRAEANKAAYEARKKEYADKWEAERPKSIKLKRVGKEAVEWKLGLGPCGRTVVSLEVSKDAYGVTIIQKCDDHKAPDFFFYPHSVVEAMVVYTTYTPEVACKVPSQE